MGDPVKLKLRQESGAFNTTTVVRKKSKPAVARLGMFVPVVLLLGMGAAGVYVFQRGGTETEKNQSTQAPQSEVQGVDSISVQQKEQSFRDEGLNFSFRFKDGLTKEDLSEQDKEAGFIARLTSDNPPMIVSVRKESGLRLPASLAKIDTAALLKNNIDKSLPQRYPNYDVDTSTTVTVNGKSVIERVFSYTGPNGERAKQRLLAILKDDDTAIYISMQTTEQGYASADEAYFEHIKTTISL